MISLDFLEQVSIFKNIDKDRLEKVIGYCNEKEYHYGDKLFSEKETATHLWIVKDGRVDLRFEIPGQPTSEKNTISTVSKAQSFGWSSLVEPNEYTLSAYCSTKKCSVVVLEKTSLLSLLDEDKKIGHIVMSNLAEIIGERFDHLVKSAMEGPIAMVKITVHLATCGIAAGAREVMTALIDEMAKSDRPDIQVVTSGCIGRCESEPNVTVEVEYADPVVYQKMNPDKIRQVFQEHILKGNVLSDFVLSDN